jgi:hypothetical protein
MNRKDQTVTDSPVEPKRPQQLEKGLLWWLLGMGIMWAAWGALYWSDNFTELLPNHDSADLFCFLLALVGALASVGIAIRYSRRVVVWRQIAATISLAMIGFLSVLLLSCRATNVIEGSRTRRLGIFGRSS